MDDDQERLEEIIERTLQTEAQAAGQQNRPFPSYGQLSKSVLEAIYAEGYEIVRRS